MNFFLRLLGAAGLAATLLAQPSRAQEISETTLAQHILLVQAAEDKGVDFVFNHPFCQRKGLQGFYDGQVLGVCLGPTGEITENDLDTIRHEAHHMVQDCLGDGKADYQFEGDGSMYPNAYELALHAGLPLDTLTRIRMAYSHLDERDFLMEVEAFYVAHAINPLQIAEAINTLCSR
jgi:hypothetical protein